MADIHVVDKPSLPTMITKDIIPYWTLEVRYRRNWGGKLLSNCSSLTKHPERRTLSQDESRSGKCIPANGVRKKKQDIFRRTDVQVRTQTSPVPLKQWRHLMKVPNRKRQYGTTCPWTTYKLWSFGRFGGNSLFQRKDWSDRPYNARILDHKGSSRRETGTNFKQNGKSLIPEEANWSEEAKNWLILWNTSMTFGWTKSKPISFPSTVCHVEQTMIQKVSTEYCERS